MATESYERAQDVKQFEDSKLGVKGLVDSGITSIPRIFVHPPEILTKIRSKSATKPKPDIIPVIDLSGVDSDLLRPTIVDKIARASRELGFFQIVNHGIGVEVTERVIGAIKGFHEQPTEIKAQVYSRNATARVSFRSNIDLFHSKAASWRDTFRVRLGANLPELDEIPEICRNEVLEWNEHVVKLGELLLGMLCEGLRLETRRLEEIKAGLMLCQYYPYCPQPDLTMGITSHTDPGALSILLQDHIGGLQVKCCDDWVDVKPVSGALVINIGDLLQIISNDEYRSVEHRVLANPHRESRLSIAVFMSPSDEDSLYGPIPELTSPEKPARFQSFTYADYNRTFHSKKLDEKSMVNYYRLSE